MNQLSISYLLIIGVTTMIVHVFCDGPSQYNEVWRYECKWIPVYNSSYSRRGPDSSNPRRGPNSSYSRRGPDSSYSQRGPDSRNPRRGPNSSYSRSNQRPVITNVYCNLKYCDTNTTHSLCKFSVDRTSTQCGSVYSYSMSADEKIQVLLKHNELRQRIARGYESQGKTGGQPAAKNLYALRWNEELEKSAQAWANQCIFGHDECRVKVHGSSVGQNIGFSSFDDTYRTVLPDLVQDWYNEVQFYDGREVRSYRSNGRALHYTQLVWAATKEVGCGLVRFNDKLKSKGLYRTQLVCNYAPEGNQFGQPVYLTY
ncbi:venom allergen 5-like [Venturia canescens]|uniref:venom allergen 5-like n=1 Tax=Venturia canescens TaxID=32260 RepID=UPI001C9BC020|nr:venom allergen 5-like [Venturia canescens]